MERPTIIIPSIAMVLSVASYWWAPLAMIVITSIAVSAAITILLASTWRLLPRVHRLGFVVLVVVDLGIVRFAGSHSYQRDLTALLIGTVAAILTNGTTRRSLFPRRRFNGLSTGQLSGGEAIRLIITFALVTWVMASGTSSTAAATLGHNNVQPAANNQLSPWRALRVRITLSGGGYRAALFHAGVLSALDDLNVPIKTISAVSGGAIIGSYYTLGGAPKDFRNAVARGRFNLTRELVDVQNAVRLIVPSVQFSRTDVQATLLDRVLLNGARAIATREHWPELMICTTDLSTGDMVGILARGYVSQPINSAVRRLKVSNRRDDPTNFEPQFWPTETYGVPGDRPLATFVAASGAFPGAFSPVRLSSRAPLPVELVLADGGITDNLGLGLPMAAAALAAKYPDHLQAWQASHVTLMSDASAPYVIKKPASWVGEIARAIDTVYATGGGSEGDRDFNAVGVILLSPDMLLPPGKRAPVTVEESLQLLQFLFDRPANRPSGRTESNFGITFTSLDSTSLRILAEDLEGDARDKVLQLLANTGAEHAIYDLFKRDVAACLHAFLNTSTLQNKITELNATRIFRLGRYLTFLNRPHIIASVSALLPSEKEVSDRAELDVFLIGRRGFLGIHKDYFAHSASFLFEFTQPSIGAYFKEVDKAATAVDWRITEATVTKRVFIRSSRAYARDPKTHFDRVTLLHQSPRNIICTTELIHGGELFPDSHSAESSRGQSFQRSR